MYQTYQESAPAPGKKPGRGWRAYLGILILDLCGRQELDGLSLEENLAVVV